MYASFPLLPSLYSAIEKKFKSVIEMNEFVSFIVEHFSLEF
jgi:hypothetical protein